MSALLALLLSAAAAASTPAASAAGAAPPPAGNNTAAVSAPAPDASDSGSDAGTAAALPAAPAAAPSPAPAVAPAAIAADAGVVEAAPVSRPSYSFFSTEEFRERRSTVADENDALARLSIDASRTSADDKLIATVGLGLWWDISGAPAADSLNAFNSIHSSTDSPLWLDVYRLNLEYRPGGALQLVRIGRQDAEHGTPATFDGADLEVNLGTPRVQLFAFGGRTVHFFEIDPKVFQDWIGSAGIDVRITQSLKVEFDYRILRDGVPIIDGASQTAVTQLVTDNTYGGTLQWRLGGWLKARAWVRGINDALESVGLAARAESAEHLLGIELKGDLQPATLNQLDELDNAYYLTLGPSLPHFKGSLDAWKDFDASAGDFSAHLGGQLRQLISDAETPFNRNLLRGYLLLSGAKLGGTEIYVTLNGEYDRDGLHGTDGTLTGTGSIGWAHKSVRLEAGTYFQRWRYVYFAQPEELANVRGYYVDASFKYRWLTVRGRYSYEIFDRILQTFTASLSQAF